MSWLDQAKALIMKHEGVRASPYKDSLGVPTIGVGFNMTRADARARLSQVGLKSWAPPIHLSDSQIQQLLALDLADCAGDIKDVIHGFDLLSDNRKCVLIDLRFNLGPMRFRAFAHMISAVNSNDFDEAANQMLASIWSTQVGNRAVEDAEMMRNG